jgi:pSer/pThr/pTyr-binding forkhead associated (FHA) protein
MDIKLAVVSGAKATTIRIHRLPATIGRSGEASLRLPTTAVSRKHCEMFEKDGELFVRDLGSRNGTKVNKEKIDDDHALQTGDLMTVGPVTFQVFCPEKKQDAADSMIDLDAEGAAAAPVSDSMSRVNYRETPDGSFISIHDAEHEDELPAKPKSSTPEKQPKVAKQVANKEVAEKKKQPTAQRSKKAGKEEVLGDFDEAAEETVDGGDSALNDFFKQLG